MPIRLSRYLPLWVLNSGSDTLFLVTDAVNSNHAILYCAGGPNNTILIIVHLLFSGIASGANPGLTEHRYNSMKILLQLEVKSLYWVLSYIVG